MKKLMLVAAMMIAAISANAQVYVGGGIGFNSHDPGKGDSQTSFEVVPEIGYHLDDSWDLGIQFGYGESEADDDIKLVDDDAKKVSAFTIAPYARYNFVKWNNVKLFLEGSIAYSNIKAEYNVGDDIKADVFKIGVAPGVSVNVGPKLTFITKVGWLGYESKKADYDGAEAVTDFGFNVSGQNLQFSLVYNF